MLLFSLSVHIAHLFPDEAFDLVAFIFGNMSWLSRIIYALVGLSGLYMISAYGRIRSN